MNTKSLSLLLAFSIALTACSSVRQTKPLSYAGDARDTVGSLEVVIQKRGYKPICSKRAYCKFQYNDQVWIHFKAGSSKVVMAIDVTDGKTMPADKQKSLTDEASAVGEAIWSEASADAHTREKAAADKEKAAAVAKADEARKEQERKAAEQKADAASGSTSGGLTSVLGAVGGVIGAVKTPAQSNASMQCCINHAYYQCPSPAAVNKCAGEAAACLSRCALGGDMGCGERCMREHPPDPSDCQRTPEKDAECR